MFFFLDFLLIIFVIFFLILLSKGVNVIDSMMMIMSSLFNLSGSMSSLFVKENIMNLNLFFWESSSFIFMFFLSVNSILGLIAVIISVLIMMSFFNSDSMLGYFWMSSYMLCKSLSWINEYMNNFLLINEKM